MAEGDKEKNIKKSKKQSKQIKTKDNKQVKTEKKIKWLYILFLKGVQHYL